MLLARGKESGHAESSFLRITIMRQENSAYRAAARSDERERWASQALRPVFLRDCVLAGQGSLPKSRHIGSLHDCVRCSGSPCCVRSLRWKLHPGGRDDRRFRPGKGTHPSGDGFGDILFSLLGFCCFRPTERFAGEPHLMHDYRQFAGHGHSCLIHAASLGDPQTPRFQCRPRLRSRRQY